MRRVVGISGSVSRPSRTSALVGTILDAFGDTDTVRHIELVDEAPHLFADLRGADLAGRGRSIVDTVEAADLLIVGTPVYRGSYTGALKHLFDLVDRRALAGKPVLLAATGGSPLHGLVTEHQLRPLFGYFNALTLPTTIYAVEEDFDSYKLTNGAVHARIARAVAEARDQLERRHHPLRAEPVRLAALA